MKNLTLIGWMAQSHHLVGIDHRDPNVFHPFDSQLHSQIQGKLLSIDKKERVFAGDASSSWGDAAMEMEIIDSRILLEFKGTFFSLQQHPQVQNWYSGWYHDGFVTGWCTATLFRPSSSL